MRAHSASGPTAIVLDINVFGGLGAVRSLGRAGVPVIGLGTDPRRFGFASRYCTARECPNPVRQPTELLDFLQREGRRLAQPGILLPASDEFVLFLSRYRDELHNHFRFSTPPQEVMEAGVNKRRQYEIAERLGVPYPKTFFPSTLDDVEQIKDQLDYPAYIKPYFSHLWRARFPHRGKGVKVHTPEELTTAFAEIFSSGLEAIVQTIVLGPNTNTYNLRVYLNESDEPLALFTSRKIRQYPVQFGVGTLVESTEEPSVVELGLRYAQGVGYRGFASIEFKRDDRDGQLKFIELNPRYASQIVHATDCGVNFPLIQYLDLAGMAPMEQTTYRTGVRWLSVVGDFRSGLELTRTRQLSLWRWLRSLAGVRSFAVFATDDPKPFLSYLLSLPFADRRLAMGTDQVPASRPGRPAPHLTPLP